VLGAKGKRGLWLGPLNGQTPPHEILEADAQQPKFGPNGEIFFRAFDGNSAFIFGVREDGTGLRKVFETPVARLSAVSRDGRWLLAKLRHKDGPTYAALSLTSGSLIPIFSSQQLSDVNLTWSPTGRCFQFHFPQRCCSAVDVPILCPWLPAEHFHEFRQQGSGRKRKLPACLGRGR